MEKNKVLRNHGYLDVLPYYSKASKILGRFLKDKKIASKVHLPNFFFLKRGSKMPSLYIEDFSVVNEKMLKLRKGHLKDVRKELNEKQQLIWEYFPPRKFSQFFYATNDEGAGKEIERIFIDIDRRKHSADDAKNVTLALLETIRKDKEFNRKLKYRVVVLWTGNSFHIYLLLKKKINLSFYNKYLSYGKKKEDSFIMKWAGQVTKRIGISVSAGHEKSEKFIILDSSNTPSGKLARAPFSLHIKKNKVDGVCVPIAIADLKKKELTRRLQKLTPEDVLRNLNSYRKLL